MQSCSIVLSSITKPIPLSPGFMIIHCWWRRRIQQIQGTAPLQRHFDNAQTILWWLPKYTLHDLNVPNEEVTFDSWMNLLRQTHACRDARKHLKKLFNRMPALEKLLAILASWAWTTYIWAHEPEIAWTKAQTKIPKLLTGDHCTMGPQLAYSFVIYSTLTNLRIAVNSYNANFSSPMLQWLQSSKY